MRFLQLRICKLNGVPSAFVHYNLRWAATSRRGMRSSLASPRFRVRRPRTTSDCMVGARASGVR